MSKKRTIKIASREYKLTFCKDNGAWFWCSGACEDGYGEIRLGLKAKDLHGLTEMLLHEVLESIFSEDGKRYRGMYFSEERTDKCLFVFDHDYLNDQLCVKLLDALLSSGFFKLIDGRPKEKKCKK